MGGDQTFDARGADVARTEAMLARRYAGCIFDFDGTLVERQHGSELTGAMMATLVDVSTRGYIALCTARTYTMMEPKLADFFARYPAVRERLLIVGENGGAGYRFNRERGIYEPFYRVAWPRDVIAKDAFDQLVTQTYGEHIAGTFTDESVTIVRPTRYLERTPDDLAAECARLETIGLEMLAHHGLDGALRLGNSSLGIIFFSADGDKDRGVREFGGFLCERGYALSEDLREIVCFGDRPHRYGNDEYFLRGEVGTPVNVGDPYPDNGALFSAYDDRGARLMGPTATARILSRLRFLELS